MQANPLMGEVSFVVRRRVDGVPEGVEKTYILCMRTHDVCSLEERTGKAYGELMGDLLITKWSSMREIVFSFLQRHHAAEFPTPPSVNLLIDDMPGKFDALFPVISNLVVANKPPKAKGKTNPRKAQAGTGASSIKSDAA